MPGVGGPSPTGSMYTGNGLLDEEAYNRARQQQSQMGLWAGLLAGSGPSLSPRGFGSSFGQGLLGMQAAGEKFDDSQLARAKVALARAGIPKTEAEIRKLDREGKLIDMVNSAMGSLLGGGGVGVGGAPAYSPMGGAALPSTGAGAPAAGGIDATLDLIKDKESGGQNIMQQVVPPGGGYNPSVGRVTGPSTAQGFYQITNTTWRQYAPEAGISTERYPNAMSAPEEVQRLVAKTILTSPNGGGVQHWADYNPALKRALGGTPTQTAQAGGVGILPLSGAAEAPGPVPPITQAGPAIPPPATPPPPMQMAQAAPLVPPIAQPQQPAMRPPPMAQPPMQGAGISPQQVGAAQAAALGMSMLGKTVPGFVGDTAGLPIAGAKAGAEAAARLPYQQQLEQFQSGVRQQEAGPIAQAQQAARQEADINVARAKAAIDAGNSTTTLIINGREVPMTTAQAVQLLNQQNMASPGQVPGAGGAPTMLGKPVDAGPISEGYRRVPAPGGGYRDDPISGSPAARALEQKETGQKQNATVVTQDIGRAIDLVNQGRVTGIEGQLLQNIPGTNRTRFDALTSGVGANLSIDRLQQMRDQSPTGGAVGQVTEGEHKLLRDSFGSLDPRQGEKQLGENLHRLYTRYTDIVNGSPAQLADALKAGKITEQQYETAMRQREYRSAAPAAPPVGAIREGYRFKGGDPADRNSWQKVP